MSHNKESSGQNVNNEEVSHPSTNQDHQPRLDEWDKCSDLVHWEDPEGAGGEGGGRGDRDGEHM